MTEKMRLFSRSSSQRVFRELVEARHNAFPEPVMVEVVQRSENGVEQNSLLPPLYLLITEDDDNVITLADGSAIFRCKTPSGQEVSVLLGKPNERMDRQAEILLGPEPKMKNAAE